MAKWGSARGSRPFPGLGQCEICAYFGESSILGWWGLTKNRRFLAKLGLPGSGFGELALLYNDKRSATIEAVDDCETYSLDGSIFKTIIIKSSIEKRSLQAGFLDKIKLFDSLDKL
jgi:CRP-like cAMP-binding protein